MSTSKPAVTEAKDTYAQKEEYSLSDIVEMNLTLQQDREWIVKENIDLKHENEKLKEQCEKLKEQCERTKKARDYVGAQRDLYHQFAKRAEEDANRWCAQTRFDVPSVATVVEYLCARSVSDRLQLLGTMLRELRQEYDAKKGSLPPED